MIIFPFTDEHKMICDAAHDFASIIDNYLFRRMVRAVLYC